CRDKLAVLLFFVQAEDGIRDFHVTGVQTCALPICPPGRHQQERHLPPLAEPAGPRGGRLRAPGRGAGAPAGRREPAGRGAGAARSEERRVGKEWRARGVALESNSTWTS